MRPNPIHALALLLMCVLAAPATVAQSRLSLIPSAKNFAEWSTFISPSEDELAYEKIGWRNQFWPAVEEARRLGRPILLWTMNGHPLGCT